MMKQKLSPVKYGTAFVPPKQISNKNKTKKRKQASFESSVTSRIGATLDYIFNISWNSFRLVAKNPMRSRSQFLFCL